MSKKPDPVSRTEVPDEITRRPLSDFTEVYREQMPPGFGDAIEAMLRRAFGRLDS